MASQVGTAPALNYCQQKLVVSSLMHSDRAGHMLQPSLAHAVVPYSYILPPHAVGCHASSVHVLVTCALQVDFTALVIQQFGWRPPSPRTAHDILPVIIQMDERKPPQMFTIPPTYITLVPLLHPHHKWFAEFDLAWWVVCG